MSQMTLRQGIETTLLEEVPELTRVLDVTDHGGGETPSTSRPTSRRQAAGCLGAPGRRWPSGSVAVCCAF